MVFSSIYYHQMNAMNSVKKSITLAKTLDAFVVRRARKTAKARGEAKINYSAALADLIIEARQQSQPLKQAA